MAYKITRDDNGLPEGLDTVSGEAYSGKATCSFETARMFNALTHEHTKDLHDMFRELATEVRSLATDYEAAEEENEKLQAEPWLWCQRASIMRAAVADMTRSITHGYPREAIEIGKRADAAADALKPDNTVNPVDEIGRLKKELAEKEAVISLAREANIQLDSAVRQLSTKVKDLETRLKSESASAEKWYQRTIDYSRRIYGI
jgi:outer membrane murein-binding lipoprotein Lpp